LLGIEYARAERWKAPEDLTHFEGGLHDGTTPGPICPQLPSSWQQPLPQSERCLTLNVWTPLRESAEDELLPVLVFVHGGAFVIGSGVGKYIAGERLNRHGALLVSLNYRLGVFGFLGHPQAEASNFGLLDQFAALRWVRRHIAEFGGDPARVTVSGESAGAVSALWLAANAQQAGTDTPLFSRVISQSSAPPLLVSSSEVAHLAAAHLQERLGCESLACLRALPCETVLAETPNFPWRRSAILYNDLVAHDIGLVSPHPGDGWRYPAEAIREGHFHADVLQGVTRHESYLFIALSHLAGTPPLGALHDVVQRAFPMLDPLQVDVVGSLYFHDFSLDHREPPLSATEMLGGMGDQQD
jgi:carboxylesterase type B